MKYKKKLGGATTVIPQPNKPPTNSPTITGSVTGTFNSVKGLYTKIILFIKTNFIFCLLVGILLLVYGSLFFVDPVTEDDLKKENRIAKITCDNFTGNCGTGKKIVSDRECENNECTADKCCVLDVKCDTFVGNCPLNKVIDSTKGCKTDNCNAGECCVKSCSGFQPERCGNTRIINISNTCANEECKIEECCVPRRTCLSSNENKMPYNCTGGLIRKSAYGTLDCPADGCSDTVCCKLNQSDGGEQSDGDEQSDGGE
jgi:hypothetical protein